MEKFKTIIFFWIVSYIIFGISAFIIELIGHIEIGVLLLPIYVALFCIASLSFIAPYIFIVSEEGDYFYNNVNKLSNKFYSIFEKKN